MHAGNDYFPDFSKQEWSRRYGRIRKAMKSKGLDCLIVYGAYSYAGTDTGQINAVYLSNYAAVVQSYVLFPLKDPPTLIIGFGLHIPNARDCSPIQDVRAGGLDLVPVIPERIKELGLEKGNLGIVGPLPSWWSSTIPAEHRDYLFEKLPKAGFQTVTEWYENIRLQKSREEAALMEKAGALTDLAHEEVFMATRPGVRHSDLRQVIEGVAGRFGGKYPFSHIGSTSMKNPDRIYPDFFPTHRTVQHGDAVMTEIAVGYGNYFGKLWGTFFVGEPTKEYKRLFNVAVSVHDRAIENLKPGMKGSDVKPWLKPMRRAGYTNAVPLIMGWSTYNHPPHCGALPGAPCEDLIPQKDLDFVFKPGHCVTVIAFPVTPDMKKGLWVGTTCLFTKKGLKKLHAYPVNRLRVVDEMGDAL